MISISWVLTFLVLPPHNVCLDFEVADKQNHTCAHCLCDSHSCGMEFMTWKAHHDQRLNNDGNYLNCEKQRHTETDVANAPPTRGPQLLPNMCVQRGHFWWITIQICYLTATTECIAIHCSNNWFPEKRRKSARVTHCRWLTLQGWCYSTTQESSRGSLRQSLGAASPWYLPQLQMPEDQDKFPLAYLIRSG